MELEIFQKVTAPVVKLSVTGDIFFETRNKITLTGNILRVTGNKNPLTGNIFFPTGKKIAMTSNILYRKGKLSITAPFLHKKNRIPAGNPVFRT